MKKGLKSLPIEDIHEAQKTKYVLKFLQQPKFARESTKSKRLLHPHPVITLNIYSEDENGTLKDITNHNLSLFFLRASVIETTPPEERDSTSVEPEKVLVGNKVITGTLYNLPDDYDLKIINSKYQNNNSNNKANSSQSTNPGVSGSLDKSDVKREADDEINSEVDLAAGALTSLSSQTSEHSLSQMKYQCNARNLNTNVYPSIEKLANDYKIDTSTESRGYNNNGTGVIAFVFSDLGVFKRGTFKLCFELFKFEVFQNVYKNYNMPKLAKLDELISAEFRVYGSRQFYKTNNQSKFQHDLEIEKMRLSSNKTLLYLRKIKVIRDLIDESPKSGTFEDDEVKPRIVMKKQTTKPRREENSKISGDEEVRKFLENIKTANQPKDGRVLSFPAPMPFTTIQYPMFNPTSPHEFKAFPGSSSYNAHQESTTSPIKIEGNDSVSDDSEFDSEGKKRKKGDIDGDDRMSIKRLLLA